MQKVSKIFVSSKKLTTFAAHFRKLIYIKKLDGDDDYSLFI